MDICADVAQCLITPRKIPTTVMRSYVKTKRCKLAARSKRLLFILHFNTFSTIILTEKLDTLTSHAELCISIQWCSGLKTRDEYKVCL